MPLFIKTEKFTKETIDMLHIERKEYLIKHKEWVESEIRDGRNIFSGYLTNRNKNPGGGGILIIEANNFEEARFIIMQDPMIKNKLVNWQLNALQTVSGDLFRKIINEDKSS